MSIASISPPERPASKPFIPKRIAWGTGGLADNLILNLVTQLILPIYNVGFGVSAVWMGLALGFPRIFDAVLDPIMGVVSDNTRGPWGRRKPYIVVGSLVCALMCFLLFLPSPHWKPSTILGYFLVIITFYSISYTLFIIPYTALGYELSSDYDERTRIQAWRPYFGLAGGFFIPWMYKLCLLPVFGGDELRGVKWVAGGTALIIAVMGVIPGLFCRENPVGRHLSTMPLRASLAETFKNKAFIILMMANIVFAISLNLGGPLLFYVNLFYVYGGDKVAAATLSGWGQTGYMLGAILALPVAGAVSARFTKRKAVLLQTFIALCGYASYLFSFSKAHPYLEIGSQFLVGFGLQGFWLLISSMIADVCDEDELVTERRREGAFGSVYSFINKASIGVATLFVGVLLSIAGYSEHLIPTQHALDNLKTLYILVQVAGIAVCMLILVRFPITRARAKETQRLLQARHARILAGEA